MQINSKVWIPMLDLADKDFKVANINMFKEVKETTYKELLNSFIEI